MLAASGDPAVGEGWRMVSRLLQRLSVLIRSLVGLAVCATLLIVWYAMFERLVADLPPGQSLARLEIPVPASNDGIVIGRDELIEPAGATSAAAQHVRLRSIDGEHYITNVAATRKALLTYSRFGPTFANRWLLSKGDRIQIGGSSVRVEAIEHGKSLTLRVERRSVVREVRLVVGTTVRGELSVLGSTPPGTAQGWVEECSPPRPWPIALIVDAANRLSAAVTGLGYAEDLHASAEQVRLSLGGHLSCPGRNEPPRVALAGAPHASAQVVERKGYFFLAPGGRPAGVTAVPVVIERGSGRDACRMQDFRAIEWPLEGKAPARGRALPACAPPAEVAAGLGRLTQIVLGRTRYQVEKAGAVVLLSPDANVPIRRGEEFDKEAKEVQGKVAGLKVVPRRANEQGAWRSVYQLVRAASPRTNLYAALFWAAPFLTLLGLALVTRLPSYRASVVAAGIRRRSWLKALPRTVLIVSTFTLAALAVYINHRRAVASPMAMAHVVIASFLLASLAVVMAARGRLILIGMWALIVMLAAAGMLSLAQLGLGSDNTRWRDFYFNQSAAYSFLSPLVVLACFVPLPFVRHLAQLMIAERPPVALRLRMLFSPLPAPVHRRRRWLGRLRRLATQVIAAVLVLVWLLAVVVLLAAAVAGVVAWAAPQMFGTLVVQEGRWTYLGYAGLALSAAFITLFLPDILFSPRALPLFVLTVVFGLYLAVGGEEGLGPFQPVELGKFAAVCFMTMLLIAIAREQQRPSPFMSFKLLMGFVAAIAFFLGIFMLIPVLKSDYSPVLIIGITSLLMAIVAGYRPVARLLFGSFESLGPRLRRAPLIVRRLLGLPPLDLPSPVATYSLHGVLRVKLIRWRLRLSLFWPAFFFRVAVLTAAIVVVAFLTGWVFQPYFVAEYDKAREELELHLAGRGVRVLAQRAISYRDLDYAREHRPGADGHVERVIDYQDLGRQVLYSRAAIATAPCYGIGDLAGDLRRFWPVALVAGRPADTRPVVKTDKPEVLPTAGTLGKQPPAVSPPADPPAGRRDGRRQTIIDRTQERPSLIGIPCRDAQTYPPFGANPPTVLRIPAVKDDFAGAFYIHRFGIYAALALLLVQTAFVMVLIAGALRARRSDAADRRTSLLHEAMFGLMLGAAILFAVHWTISWSNLLGLLPVMGQPMTFLSVGGSHLTFMAFPLLALAVVAMRIGIETVGTPRMFVPRRMDD